jgi:thiosulfate/3-mercaptopyruvate sulfurtransferase
VWLAALISGEPLIAAPCGAWHLFEVGCDAEVLFLLGHIPGAGYIETHQLEHAPLWNKVPDQALLRVLLDIGIRHDTTVLLYGRNDLAPVRAAHLNGVATLTTLLSPACAHRVDRIEAAAIQLT